MGLAKNGYHHEIGRKKIHQMVYSDPEKLNGRPDFGLFIFFLNVLVQERCRRRLFLLKKHVFGPGTLPQAPFFTAKTRFWSWNVAAGAFFCCKNTFLVLNIEKISAKVASEGGGTTMGGGTPGLVPWF